MAIFEKISAEIHKFFQTHKPHSAPQRPEQAGPPFERLLRQVFARLRRDEFDLGVSELLAALDLAQSDLVAGDPDELRAGVRLVWCKTPEEQLRFDAVWQAALAAAAPPFGTDAPAAAAPAETPPPPADAEQRAGEAGPQLAPQPAAAEQEWGVLPVHAPLTPISRDRQYDLQTYGPVSRRAMAYGWRQLRRPLADGPADALDVETTVTRAARQGFFLAPVYGRRERNHAHLLLLIDQGGSMTPLHRFSRDLVETACAAQSTLARVEVVYFHNVPGEYVYDDPHLTHPRPRDDALAGCRGDTSVLIVSDAGAVRGRRELARIRATTSVLFRLKQITPLLAWLNPMPQTRWPGTSAQIIKRLVPMYQMDWDGFSSAIDVLRGQPLYRR
jgi:hypothetical protein